MRQTAAMAETWLSRRQPAAFARPIDAEGLGPRRGDDALLIGADGRTEGVLLGGAADAQAVPAAVALLNDPAARSRVLPTEIAFDDATAAGLTCGGQVNILINRLDDIPVQLWDAMASGMSAALVSNATGDLLVVVGGGATFGTLGSADLDELSRAEAEPMLAQPGLSARHAVLADVEVLIECWTPVPRLVVVGAAAVADALAAQAALLGWEPAIVANVDAAIAATQALTASDIVVVLEHRPSIATPVLAAALRGAVGYVGALGSRRTQEVRRTALLDAGVTQAELAQLHGPTGLDIGARSAGETAVSIAAEIIAVRSGRDPRPLRDTATRIST